MDKQPDIDALERAIGEGKLTQEEGLQMVDYCRYLFGQLEMERGTATGWQQMAAAKEQIIKELQARVRSLETDSQAWD